MNTTKAPWWSRPALTGAGLGFAGGLFSAGQQGGFVVRFAILLAFTLAGYFTGFAIAARRRLAAAATAIARLRAELRASQDYIMDHGSSRSLPAWLETAGPALRDTTTALAAEARGLAADAALSDAARSAAAAIAERAERLAGLCAPFVRYAPAEPARAPFDLNTQVREALVLCRHRAEEKSIRFEERFAVIPPVFGPAGRVQTALLNVIVNAVEAMPFGGGRISIATAHEGDRVVVRIVDGGIGIRPEHLAKVTEALFTTKPGKTDAGLGLWETRATVESIGGTLSIRSVPHQGTEVMLSFPQAAPLSAGRAGVAHPEEVARNLADEGDRRIA